MSEAEVTDVHALQEALDIIADAVHDYLQSKNSSSGILTYANLLPELMGLIPDIGKIPAEIKDLSALEGVHLVGELSKRVGITDAHSLVVLDASLKTLNDIVLVLMPDVKNLVAAIQAAKA